MSREELEAMRKERWEAMRKRAAEMGRELPETPPWEAAEQRRKEMMEKYEAYRAIIEAMTDEQKEAISALFGRRGAGTSPMTRYGAPMGRCAKPGCMQPGMMPYRGMGPGMMPMMPPTGPAEAQPAPEEPAAAPESSAPAPAPVAPAQPAG
jgi:hypothetical protein